MYHLRRYKEAAVFSQPPAESSFFGLDRADIDAHFGIRSYRGFVLTDAVTPSYDLQVVPEAGFAAGGYKDRQNIIPMLTIAASKEHLFELFLELAGLMGQTVDVVLETSHHLSAKRFAQHSHQDFYVEQMDLTIVQSILYDFEALLLNDGSTGIVIINPGAPMELQFDEHKLLTFCNWTTVESEALKILEGYNIPRNDGMKFIADAEHVHTTSGKLRAQFRRLRTRLGADR
jgi:hypothetical protein